MMVKIDDYILYQDESIIAINKPSGLLSIPDRSGSDGSLKQLLQQQSEKVYTVHRLDKETSGVIIFAKTEEAHKYFSQQFETRETKKIYNGLVIGIPAITAGTINEPLAEHPRKKGMMTIYRKGKESITEYKLIESFRFYSWMEFNILTGRTHQIRVHMKHAGHPIVCDPLYGDGKPIYISKLKNKFKLSQSEEEERPILSRLALHSSKLTLKMMNGNLYDFEAPLPKDLKATLNQLSKHTVK
jgi:23S rRNA pseudouridine1911/1915/1917 synthase